jgi:hypothetical protein
MTDGEVASPEILQQMREQQVYDANAKQMREIAA